MNSIKSAPWVASLAAVPPAVVVGRPTHCAGRALALLIALATAPLLRAADAPATPPQAARSVHLSYPAPAGRIFYNELTVEESTPATYFMACGFSHGYFGMQELEQGRDKIVLFSVWDPGTQDDPNRVAAEQRVEVLYQAADVRVGRFGGEGTGGQSFFKYPWKTGETCRFLVHATTNENRTAFAAYFYLAPAKTWKHLVTFRTLTKGEPLGGYYSFIEDFRRDGRSPHERRRARFGHGWVQTLAGDWAELTQAKFTGDATPLDNIDAGVAAGRFYLATGGNTTNTLALRASVTRPASSQRPPELENWWRQFSATSESKRGAP